MAAHARLKTEFTEGEKYHNLMNWLKFDMARNIYYMFIIVKTRCRWNIKFWHRWKLTVRSLYEELL